MTKSDIFLAILPVVLERKYADGSSSAEVAFSARDIADEIYSAVNKMSKSTDEDHPEQQ